jgi:outer membrane lipoprotein-sorting protein
LKGFLLITRKRKKIRKIYIMILFMTKKMKKIGGVVIMRYKILILFAVLLFVSGCAQAPETQEPTAPEDGVVPEETPEETPEEEPEEEQRVMSEELLLLLARAEEKVNSMSYLYYGPPDSHIGYEFHVMGSNIKVVLPSRVRFDTNRYYDTAYLDTEEQTAFGYCEAPGCEDKETAFTLKYDDYIRDTPLDKLSLLEYGEIKAEETIESRKVKLVEFEGENMTGKMWIDTYSGLPLKVEETVAGDTLTTEFRNMGINSVTESDVTR